MDGQLITVFSFDVHTLENKLFLVKFLAQVYEAYICNFIIKWYLRELTSLVVSLPYHLNITCILIWFHTRVMHR